MFKCLSPGAIGIRNATLQEALELARAGGFDAIDFSIAEINRVVNIYGLDAVRGMFAQAGVKLGCWALPVNWRAELAEYDAQLASLPTLAALGVALGAERTQTWIPSGSDERPFEENMAWHVERFRPIAEVLAGLGCRLGLEFLGPKTLRTVRKYEFFYTMAGALDLAARIGTGNLGLLLDAWHLYTSGGAIADLDQISDAQVVTVHVNDAPAGIPLDEQRDNVRCLPMESGVMDLAGFMRALARMGYTGPVIAEPFSQRTNELAATDRLAAVMLVKEHMDRLWATLPA